MVTHPENRTGIDRLRGFVRDLIGPGRPYASARDMADSLHLADGRATILYKFLKGAEPRAGVVLDWLEHLGITVIPVLPGKGRTQVEGERHEGLLT